jgi:hypothetical protein
MKQGNAERLSTDATFEEFEGGYAAIYSFDKSNKLQAVMPMLNLGGSAYSARYFLGIPLVKSIYLTNKLALHPNGVIIFDKK